MAATMLPSASSPLIEDDNDEITTAAADSSTRSSIEADEAEARAAIEVDEEDISGDHDDDDSHNNVDDPVDDNDDGEGEDKDDDENDEPMPTNVAGLVARAQAYVLTLSESIIVDQLFMVLEYCCDRLEKVGSTKSAAQHYLFCVCIESIAYRS
jgi:hypothetical protein